MIDFELRNELIRRIPNLKQCFQCGTCTAACDAEKYIGALNPRRKILAALYGDKEVLSVELYKCTTCNACNEKCPQDVNPFEVLQVLKNIAHEKGMIDRKTGGENVLNTGYSFDITDMTVKQRQELGLPALNKKDILRKICDEKS